MTDIREKLAAQIRDALSEFNDQELPVLECVKNLVQAARTGGDVEPKELGSLILPAVDGGEYPDCDIEWDSGVAERLQEQLACHEDVNLPIYVGGAPPQTAKVPEGLINSLSVIEKYIRDEADFNRSWTDGRRGGEPDSHPAGYNERRLQVAAERDEWADGLAKAIAMLTAAPQPEQAAPDVSILTSRLAREFPRIDPDNPKPLDEEVHCCETVLYRERERLHEALSLFREKQT